MKYIRKGVTLLRKSLFWSSRFSNGSNSLSLCLVELPEFYKSILIWRIGLIYFSLLFIRFFAGESYSTWPDYQSCQAVCEYHTLLFFIWQFIVLFAWVDSFNPCPEFLFAMIIAWEGSCQFSCTCNSRPEAALENDAWDSEKTWIGIVCHDLLVRLHLYSLCEIYDIHRCRTQDTMFSGEFLLPF